MEAVAENFPPGSHAAPALPAGKTDLILGGATECVPLCENEYVLDSNLAKVLAS